MECVRCGQEINTIDLVYCGKCESPHHAHCWESFHKQCADHGCTQTDLIVKQVYELASRGNYNVARHMVCENADLITTIDPKDILEDLRESEINYHKIKAARNIDNMEDNLAIWRILALSGFLLFVLFIIFQRMF